MVRISGLASGMDIDQLVSDLMKAERMPLDKMLQKKQLLEWQRDDYRSMNTLLNDLDKTISDFSGGIWWQSTYLKKSVTSTDENAVSVRNINSVSDITSTISVTQLAENAYMFSGDEIGTDIDPNATLDSQKGKLTSWTSNSFTIQSIQADGTLGDAVEITFDPTNDSLNDVINKINESEAGVTAFFDTQTGKVSLTAKNTGDVDGQPEIILTGDFFTNTLKLSNDNIAAGANGRQGKNAIFTINGLETERTSNTFTINGFEYTLKSATTSPVTITSTTDVDSIFDSVKKFVDKYNEIIEKINNELSEDRYRNYQPLTSEQKEAMKEREIELWEEKARSGMLKGDMILSSGLNQMRLDLYSTVSGVNTDFNQLAEIGIKTSNVYQEHGKLVIDEKKLREAIKKDPNAIYKLFTAGESKDSFENKGIARRLRDTIKNTIDRVEEKAGKAGSVSNTFTIGKNLDDLDDRIDAFQERLKDIENRYYRQFTAMEKAIQRANSQAMYFMQQFGGGY